MSHPAKRPRVLLVTSRKADYLQDLTWAGLLRVLGPSRAQALPLRSAYLLPIKRYPRNLGHEAHAFRTLLNRRSAADVVVLAAMKPDAIARYAELLPDIPASATTVLLDGGDRPEIGGDCDRLGCREAFDAIESTRPFDIVFKRELLAGQEHDRVVHPLPFSFHPARLRGLHGLPSRYDVTFWAVESDPIRTRALELLEPQFDCAANGTTRGQEFSRYKRRGRDYLRELGASRIALDFRGGGEDTLRYWELAGLGVFTIAQRRTQVIPHAFEPGVEIVHPKDDLSDLVELCERYLADEPARRRIATAFRQKAEAHHSITARAGQFLAAL